MMKGFISTICIATACTIISCKENIVIDDAWEPAEAFVNGEVTLSAIPDTVATGHTTTITTRCVPIITGKGHTTLSADNEVSTDGWMVVWPYERTLRAPWASWTTLSYPAEFKANQPFEQEWDIIPLPAEPGNPAIGGYYFTAEMIIDSIYVADSSRYYSMGSAIARRYSPHGVGFSNYAKNAIAFRVGPRR